MDGFRDLLLSPLSFVAALSDLISGNRGNDANFYSLLRAGRRTDEWIDLFGAARRVDGQASETELDRALDKLEQELAASYRDGKLNAAAREALQRANGLLKGAGFTAGAASQDGTAPTADAKAGEPAGSACQDSDDKP